MKTFFYRLLVSRNACIAAQFQEYQSTRHAKKRLSGAFSAFFQALSLNFRWHVLRDRSIGQLQPHPFGGESESGAAKRETPAAFAEHLKAFDAVSFDVFDTLVFRPFSAPKELFGHVGEQLGVADFIPLRVDAEHTARVRNRKRQGNMEVTLREIYAVVAERVPGLDAEAAAALELAEELLLCEANPYMQQVFGRLLAHKIPVYLVSDMYLSAAELTRLLTACGYAGWTGLFVSSEYHASKFDGGLYRIVRAQLPEGCRAAHVGDHPRSDIAMAAENGFTPFLYENVNTAGRRYRALGGCVGGLTNAYLHCGLTDCTPSFEFGFVYAGPLLVSCAMHLMRQCRDGGLIAVRSPELTRILRVLMPEIALQLWADGGEPCAAWSDALPSDAVCDAIRAGDRTCRQGEVLAVQGSFAEGCCLPLLGCPATHAEEALRGACAFARYWKHLLERCPAICTLPPADAVKPLQMAVSDAAYCKMLAEQGKR